VTHIGSQSENLGRVQRQQANRSVLIGEDHQQLHRKENSLQQPSDLDKKHYDDQLTIDSMIQRVFIRPD
jgi:hypothetical protein